MLVSMDTCPDRVRTDAAVFWQMQGLNSDGTRNANLPVLINLDNFIDYMALHIYAAAIDWPGQETWAGLPCGSGLLASFVATPTSSRGA